MVIYRRGGCSNVQLYLFYYGIKSSIDNDVPVFITSTDYYFTYDDTLPSVSSSSGNHTLSIDYAHSWGIANAHTFVGYGYAYYTITQVTEKEVWSPTWSDPFRTVIEYSTEVFTEEFVKVADGWGGKRYYNYSQSNKTVASVRVYK